ncbi:MAG: hypothetical protein AAFP98_03120 [Pseudomonadota bacterium]
MKMKTTTAALILLLSPAAAFAYCNGAAHEAQQQAAISCAEGMVFDTESQTCVAETTS